MLALHSHGKYYCLERNKFITEDALMNLFNKLLLSCGVTVLSKHNVKTRYDSIVDMYESCDKTNNVL